MTSIFTSATALAALAASEMMRAQQFYPGYRERHVSKTINVKRPFRPYLGNIDLLGKSHGNGTSKRKRRRT